MPSVSDWFSGWRVITDFGADPTGNTDSSVPLTRAIASLPVGGMIIVPSGTFRFTQPVVWGTSTNVVVWFAGGASRIGDNSAFTATGTGNIIVTWNGSNVPLTSVNAAQALQKTSPNSISEYCDGTRASFPLRTNQTLNQSSYNSIDCQVVINGSVQKPYRQESSLPWISPIDQAGQFRMVVRPINGVSQSVLVINRPPSRGADVQIQLPNENGTTSTSVRRYPLPPRFIALGV